MLILGAHQDRPLLVFLRSILLPIFSHKKTFPNKKQLSVQARAYSKGRGLGRKRLHNDVYNFFFGEGGGRGWFIVIYFCKEYLFLQILLYAQESILNFLKIIVII